MAEDRGYAPDFVSAETLAYRLDCSRSTIDVYVEKGLLPKPIRFGNLVRWHFSDVRELILAHANGNARADGEDDFLKAVANAASEKRKA